MRMRPWEWEMWWLRRGDSISQFQVEILIHWDDNDNKWLAYRISYIFFFPHNLLEHFQPRNKEHLKWSREVYEKISNFNINQYQCSRQASDIQVLKKQVQIQNLPMKLGQASISQDIPANIEINKSVVASQLIEIPTVSPRMMTGVKWSGFIKTGMLVSYSGTIQALGILHRNHVDGRDSENHRGTQWVRYLLPSKRLLCPKLYILQPTNLCLWESIQPIEIFPIVMSAIAYGDPITTTNYILVFHDSLYYGKKLDHTINKTQ